MRLNRGSHYVAKTRKNSMKKNLPFPDYRHTCGWNQLLGLRKNPAALQSDTQCDIAVIGAGFTGIAAARRIGEISPESDVVLLDASLIGEGNSGRNSGFLLEVALAHDADLNNISRMQRCNAMLQATMAGISDDVARHDIHCELIRCGTYRAAAGRAGARSLDRYRAFLEASELPCETLDAEETRFRIGTCFYRHALFSPHCYLVQPAALIRGLARCLPGAVRLFENSPVISVGQRKGRWELQTSGGKVHATKVIIANNAFCKGLGFGADRIAAIYTYAAFTEPLDGCTSDELGNDRQWGVLPAHRLGSTLRRTVDNRLLIRTLYSYERDASVATVEPRLRDALTRRYPQLANTPFTSVWGGATGFTYNAAPLWGEPATGLYISTGCNGGGVVKGTLFGKLLAERALGQETVDVQELFGVASRMPPEPVRKLGFTVIAALERIRARAEV